MFPATRMFHQCLWKGERKSVKQNKTKKDTLMFSQINAIFPEGGFIFSQRKPNARAQSEYFRRASENIFSIGNVGENMCRVKLLRSEWKSILVWPWGWDRRPRSCKLRLGRLPDTACPHHWLTIFSPTNIFPQS